MTRALVALTLAVFTLAVFAFSALHESPCASVAGQGQMVAYTSGPPLGSEFCTPHFSQVGEAEGGLIGPVQPGG